MEVRTADALVARSAFDVGMLVVSRSFSFGSFCVFD